MKFKNENEIKFQILNNTFHYIKDIASAENGLMIFNVIPLGEYIKYSILDKYDLAEIDYSASSVCDMVKNLQSINNGTVNSCVVNLHNSIDGLLVADKITGGILDFKPYLEKNHDKYVSVFKECMADILKSVCDSKSSNTECGIDLSGAIESDVGSASDNVDI